MQTLTPQAQHTAWTLAAAMMAAAASDADTARIDRALDLVETVEPLSYAPSVYLVRSASEPDRAYRVQNNLCNCPDTPRERGARHCKHEYAVQLFNQIERLDAEQTTDDTYYCVLCDEPIPAAEVVETRWGFMHERCAASEPHTPDVTPPAPCTVCGTVPVAADGCCARCLHVALLVEEDADTTGYTLTGKGYWALVPTAALPNPVGTITRTPYTAAQAKIADELGMADDGPWRVA